MCPYTICVLCVLLSIWGLGTPLRGITSHCQLFTAVPKSHRDSKRNYFKHERICASSGERGEAEEHGGFVGCNDWTEIGGYVHMVVRGRKGAGEADRATPEGWTRQHSAPRWVLTSFCCYVFRCAFLLSAWLSVNVPLSVYLSDGLSNLHWLILSITAVFFSCFHVCLFISECLLSYSSFIRSIAPMAAWLWAWPCWPVGLSTTFIRPEF